jgi:hypothetical protein
MRRSIFITTVRNVNPLSGKSPNTVIASGTTTIYRPFIAASWLGTSDSKVSSSSAATVLQLRLPRAEMTSGSQFVSKTEASA